MKPQSIARLRDSWEVFRRRPVSSLGLGFSVLLSLVSVCCGVGVLAAPWFACELIALQIGVAARVHVPRRWEWVGAALTQSCAVLVVSAGTWLAASALGPAMATVPSEEVPIWGSGMRTVLIGTGAASLGICFFVPFVFSPHILIHRGGLIRGALAESARIVFSGGVLAHIGFSLVAHGIQLAPVFIGASIAALIWGGASVPFGLLAGAILLGVSIPLGQGMIATQYVERSDETPMPGHTSTQYGLPGALSGALAILTVLPAVALLLVWSSVLIRPSALAPGAAPSGEVVVDQATTPPREVFIPDTTLSLLVSSTQISVRARDGGGAGHLPLAEDVSLDRVLVVRVRDVYAIELRSGDRNWVTHIDRAGVRLDDDLAAHLRNHIGTVGFAVVVLSLLLIPFAVGATLARLGEVLRSAALRPELQIEDAVLKRRHRQAVRRGWLAVLVSAPAALLSLYYGILATGIT